MCTIKSNIAEENVKKNREVDQKIPMKIQSCYPHAQYSIHSYDHKSFPKYRKSSIEPPPRAYLFQTHLRGGGLFNFAQTMVSVHDKELECKEEKLKYEKLEVMQPRIKKQIKTSSWWKKASAVHTKFKIRDWLIQSII